MHGLPKNIDLTFFRGKRLLQLCVGLNEVIINFDVGVSITAECRIRVDAPDGTSRAYIDSTDAATGLFDLLQRAVESVEGRTDGELILRFDNNWVVHLYDESAHYESYTIHNGDDVIVV